MTKLVKLQDEELQKLYKQYKTNNWGYTGELSELEIPGIGVMKIRTFPSGAKYVLRGTTLERMNGNWFIKMDKLIQKENAERKNAESLKDV